MLPSLLAADYLPPLWMSGADGRLNVMPCGLAECDALVVHEKHATFACAVGEVLVVD
jgi:hypothetical protein